MAEVPSMSLFSVDLITPAGRLFRQVTLALVATAQRRAATATRVKATTYREAPMDTLVWRALEQANTWDLKREGEWIGQIYSHSGGYLVVPSLRPDLRDLAEGPYETRERAMQAVSSHLGSP